MRTLNLFILLLVMHISSFSQDFEKNNCSDSLQIKFIGKNEAETTFKEHKLATEYLNIIINESGIYYKGKLFSYSDKSLLSNVIREEVDLTKSFLLRVGINNYSKFEIFLDLICFIKDEYSGNISAVELYHFNKL